MKKCSKCQEFKTLDEFYRNKARYDGYCNFCKNCDKNKPINKETKKAYRAIYKVKNAEKMKSYYKEYYLGHKDAYYERCKKWGQENPEQQRSLWRKYYQTERGKKRHAFQEAKRRAQKLNATPKWVNMEEIRKIYLNCPPGYHVDHIMPLNHPLLCGLHVPWNLQYLPAEENIRKNNKVEGLDGKI